MRPSSSSIVGISERPPSPGPGLTAQWLTTGELEAELQISGRTRCRYEANGLPRVQVGRRKYYDPGEVRAWLRDHGSRGWRK